MYDNIGTKLPGGDEKKNPSPRLHNEIGPRASAKGWPWC